MRVAAPIIAGTVAILLLLYEAPAFQQEEYIVYVGNITTSVVPDVVEDIPGKTCLLEHPDGGYTIFLVPSQWRLTPRLYERGWILLGRGYTRDVVLVYVGCPATPVKVTLHYGYVDTTTEELFRTVPGSPQLKIYNYWDCPRWREGYGAVWGLNKCWTEECFFYALSAVCGGIWWNPWLKEYTQSVMLYGGSYRANEYDYYYVAYPSHFLFCGAFTTAVYFYCLGRYRAMIIDPQYALGQPVKYVNCVLKWRHEKAALLPRGIDVWH